MHFKENDVKLGFMSFFTKAVVAALKKAPLLNAEIQGDQIVLKNTMISVLLYQQMKGLLYQS